jgi:hypothetical protein
MLSTSVIALQEITSMIKQSTNYTIHAVDIHNTYKEIHLENLVSKTSIEFLITILKSSNYTFEYKLNDIEPVTYLFFTYPQSIKIF